MSNEVDSLLTQVYDELRQLAGRYLRKEGVYHTLQPTALVHEAYFRLVALNRMSWQGRTHFFAMAATQMRRVLVEHARAARTRKRGAKPRRITLQEDMVSTRNRMVEVLALDQALTRLTTKNARRGRVAELRLFTGMQVQEVADALGVSERTIREDWRVGRAWLARELGKGMEA